MVVNSVIMLVKRMVLMVIMRGCENGEVNMMCENLMRHRS